MLIPNAELIHETELAILIELLTDDEDVEDARFWIPKSMIPDYEDVIWLDEEGHSVADIETVSWYENDELEEALERC